MTIVSHLSFLNFLNPIKAQSALTLGCMANDPYAVGMDLSLELMPRKPQSGKVFVVTNMCFLR